MHSGSPTNLGIDAPYPARRYPAAPGIARRLSSSLQAPPAAPAVNNVDGVWSAVNPWPLIAIHAALTPDGRVLTYGTNGAGAQTGYFIYDIWDPSAGPAGGHVTLDNLTQTDIFCSSQIILPQTGQILITGGDNWTGTGTTNTGNNKSNLFDFTDNSLTGAGHHEPRPLVFLVDGADQW